MSEIPLVAEKKSLDENGNAVHGYGGERKKMRKKNTQDAKVLTYKSENVEGHVKTDNINEILKHINGSPNDKVDKEKRGGKKNNNPTKGKSTTSGAKSDKPRGREKDSKRDQVRNKLHKSNSLEEISKTKLEDLTVEKNANSRETESTFGQRGKKESVNFVGASFKKSVTYFRCDQHSCKRKVRQLGIDRWKSRSEVVGGRGKSSYQLQRLGG